MQHTNTAGGGPVCKFDDLAVTSGTGEALESLCRLGRDESGRTQAAAKATRIAPVISDTHSQAVLVIARGQREHLNI